MEPSKSVKHEEDHHHHHHHQNNPYKLFDLIPTNREWLLHNDAKPLHPRVDGDNLELRLGLGLPGDQEQTTTTTTTTTTQVEDKTKKSENKGNPVVDRDNNSLHQRHHHQQVTHYYCHSCRGSNIRCSCKNPAGQDHHNPQQHHNIDQYIRLHPAPPPPWAAKDAGGGGGGGGGGGFRPPPPPARSSTYQAPANNTTSTTTTALPPSQKRAAPGPVVGWPPIRSFRKNLATTNNNPNKLPANQNQIHNQNGYHPSSSGSGSRPAAPASTTPPITEKQHQQQKNKKPAAGQFVKINMDGVPIGRKVDLSNFDSYEKLSSSVDELFRGLLAAQSGGAGIQTKEEGDEGKPMITGLLDGKGEYTLVYEDHEGDRMLVGDVPWHMFLSTVKRLRVLKSSELLKLSKGGTANNNGKEQGKAETASSSAAATTCR